MQSNPWNQAGWIFTPLQDFSFFVVPTIAAFLLRPRFVGVDPATIALSYYLFVHVPLNDGHVFTTLGPALRRVVERRINGAELVVGPACVLLFSLLFLSYARDLFFTAFSIVAIHHIMAQQHGWVMVSRRKAADPPAGRIFDTVEIWNMMLPPVIWWLSPMSAMAKRYLFAPTLLLSFSSSAASRAISLHWAINALYIGYQLLQVRRKIPLNLGKLGLLAATWLWFYPSLVIYGSAAMFFNALLLIHSLPYLKYSRLDAATPTRGVSPPFWSRILDGLGNPFVALLFCVVMGELQYALSPALSGFFGARPFIEIALLAPAMLHYYFDAFIWRRSRWLIPAAAPALSAP